MKSQWRTLRKNWKGKHSLVCFYKDSFYFYNTLHISKIYLNFFVFFSLYNRSKNISDFIIDLLKGCSHLVWWHWQEHQMFHGSAFSLCLTTPQCLDSLGTVSHHPQCLGGLGTVSHHPQLPCHCVAPQTMPGWSMKGSQVKHWHCVSQPKCLGGLSGAARWGHGTVSHCKQCLGGLGKAARWGQNHSEQDV